MKSPVRVTLRCGHCGEPYRDRATQLKPGSMTTCEHCGTSVFLDADDPIHAQILRRAQDARDLRRARLRDLRAGWVTPYPLATSAPPIVETSDILAKLDSLLRQLAAMNTERHRL